MEGRRGHLALHQSSEQTILITKLVAALNKFHYPFWIWLLASLRCQSTPGLSSYFPAASYCLHNTSTSPFILLAQLLSPSPWTSPSPGEATRSPSKCHPVLCCHLHWRNPSSLTLSFLLTVFLPTDPSHPAVPVPKPPHSPVLAHPKTCGLTQIIIFQPQKTVAGINEVTFIKHPECPQRHASAKDYY